MNAPILNSAQLKAARAILSGRAPMTNSIQPTPWNVDLARVSSRNAKHNLFHDFGYPGLDELEFYSFYQMFRRNGFAQALVTKTALKTWQDIPTLRENEEGPLTAAEEEIGRHFERNRIWQSCYETDLRSMVGKYSCLILRLGDGKPFDQPVERVPGGIGGLIGTIPAWEKQLEPSSWDTDAKSEGYGTPTMFRYNEASVDPELGKSRSFSVHPDRVIVWSPDGTTFGESKLEPIYNALYDMEKIRGAGAEGFWKNAKSQPVLQASPEINFQSLADMLGTDLAGLPDALDNVVEKWSKGFDQSLVLQGMDAKTLPVTLPQPEQFYNAALMEVSAAWPIPQRVLTGMQTGERASTEDAREWAQANMSRRTNLVIPSVMELVSRLERFGIVPERNWYLDWPDLTAPTLSEKLEIGERMAKINQAMLATGEPVFTDDEIRDVAGYEAIEDSFVEVEEDE